MSIKDNAGRMSTNYPLLDSYLTLTRPLHAYRSIVYFFAVFAMLLIVGAWSVPAWGAYNRSYRAAVGVGKGSGTAKVTMYWKYMVSGEQGSATSSGGVEDVTCSQSKLAKSSLVSYRCEYTVESAGTGYHFDGWYSSSDCSGTAASTSSTYEARSFTTDSWDITRYAKFSPNEYTVTYDAKGGSVSPGSKKVTFDGTYGSLATPTKTGYTFDGWYTAASDGTQVTSSTKVTTASDHKLYAHWTANTYYVAFYGNGATSGSMSNQEFTYGASAQALTANSYGRQYTVSYEANGGTTATTNATNTTATYTFKNWNTKEDGSGLTYGNTQSVNNIATSGTLNLYAQWNSDYVKLPNATKDGGVLDAWYNGDVNVEANRVGAAGENYTPTANVTLTAKWIDKYTPEFGGSDHDMKVGDVLTNAFTFTHTSNPTVHISPAGIITYDASTNKVTAVGAGTATIYFTQAGTSTILPGESEHWTFTVTRVANNLALTSTSASKYVDEVVEGIIQTKNSDATVQTSSDFPTIAYYDVANNKIVIPNSEAKSFTTQTVTITIWQAQTVKYEASEKTFTLTVNKYPASFSGSDYNLMVDGTQKADYVYTNTSAGQPTANSSDNFYYTIDDVDFTNSAKNKGANLVTFNPANKQIKACNAGTAKITLHQKETYKHTAAEKSFNVAVYKYNSVFATNTVNVKVEATNATSPYTLTYVKPDNSYISTESVVEGTPSLNSGEYYYTLTHNVTTSNTSGSSDATKAIEYVAGTKTVTGKNAGNATIHLYQTETYKYNAADASFNVAVTKNANTIYVKGNANYSSSIYRDSYDNGLTITATNTDYANYPIQVTQTAGEDVATYYPNQNAVYSSYKTGTATWSLSQPENYRYLAGSGSFSVSVVQQAEATDCYVLANQSDDQSVWHGKTCHEHTWNDENAAGVVHFQIYKNGGSIDPGYKVQQYLNGQWVDVTAQKSDHTTSWTWKSETLNRAAKGVRIWGSGSLYNHVKNVYVTRALYLNAADLTVDKKSDNTPLYPGEKGVGTLKIDYSLANGGNLKIANDNPDKFTVSPTTISNVDCKTGTANIAIEYTSATAGTDVAHLVIYNNVYRKEVTITGKTIKRTPTVNWSSDAEYFNVDDVLSATNANGLKVTLSGNTDYVHCENNSAIMLAATTGTIDITAHVEHNDIYDDADIKKTITITNKEKQTISWNQDFSRLNTTDGSKSIVLNGTASSGLAVSYELNGDKTGLNLTQSGDVWTLTYSATECKNTTIIAKQAGDDTYAPASSVSKLIKVIDPTKVCDTDETLVNSTVNLENESTTYNIDIPSTMTIQVSRAKTNLWNVYLYGFKVEFYSGRNGTGSKLQDFSYEASEINNSKTIELSGLNVAAKSVKLISEASNGYNVTSVTYTKQKYCNISKNSLTFNTNPNTKTEAQSFNVDYANYPISLECSNNKFTVSPTSFGDCSEYGTQSVSVSYTAGAEEGNDVGYLYIKDNTGATLKTCTLNVSISKVAQSITSTNILMSYVTTDKVTLTAEANSGLTDFTYSASPEGIASFNGSEMTFVKGGTIAITVSQAGNNIYRPTSTTVENVKVNKATPDIATLPTGTSIVYNQTLNNSTLSGGAAETTFRGEANTPVEGTFVWTNPTQKITDNVGTHNYSVTFTPTDGNMYNTKEFYIPIEVTRTTQSIVMNNGTVKVAVDGIDAGAEDSYIVLDDLIQSQTSNGGSVSYAVTSENKGNATIGVGNIFSATAVGTYTIRATKAETDYYSQATAEFTVTVGKRANTLVVSGTAFEKYVDEEVTAVRDAQNSDAQVQTSSDFPTIAYYDVDNNKIVIPNSESEEQMFGNQKTVTIKIWQDATERFEASGEKTITLTVKKYVTAITGTDQAVKVNGSKTADYAFANTITSKPSSNLTDDFYYTIDEPNYENAALNNGEGLITFNPNTNVISGLNAGTTKITFYHKETRKYTGTSLICHIAVEKKANEIANSWNVWQKAMNESASANVSFSSTRGDYANSPIVIERVYGEDVAAMSGDASGATITTNTTKGYAIWHLSQAENYEYYAAEADLMVTVGVPAPPTCYVYEDDTEHEFMTHITDAEGHFETPIAINSPIDKIWYSAKKSSTGYNYFAVQYSTDNEKTWSTISSPDLDDEYRDYSATFPTMSGNKKITHVRFGAKTGGTLRKWYKNVKISRKSYFNIQDAEQNNISSLPTMMCTIDETSTATAKFYIDYSTCAGEITLQSSNPEHFTVSRTVIDITANSDNANSAKEEITVTYNSAELGTHNAVITIRTEYQTRALSVSGETTKRTPTLTWQEGYTNNPLTLPIGLTVSANKPAARSTSTAAVMYESSNASVIEITDNGYGFRVIGLGSATLTATVPENDKWKSISDTRVIHATEKTVQEIVWDQSFPRFMELNSVIDLDAKVYLRQMSTNSLTYSAARTANIIYSCPVNNVVSVDGKQMTILNYGEVKVTASVSGNSDYEAAVPVVMLINVRQPSDGCETPLVINRTDIIDMFEVNVDFSNYSNLTTQEMVSEELLIDPAYGKPDKLSFQYEGEEFNALIKKYFGGYIKFEQRVNSQWIPVDGSRVETVKNEWNAKSGLQLDENADALRIIREKGATGHHKIKDLQVTRKQYLRATTQETIYLGELKKGQTKNTTIGFEYSDIKGDLTARTINETTGVTIANNGAIDLECGSFGHYDLPITFTPDQVGEWEGTVEIYDPRTNLSISIALTATVADNEEFIFNKEGNWNESENWTTNQVPTDANVTIAQNTTINSDASEKSITINEGVTVTVASGVTLRIGNGSPKSQTAYGNLYVEDGGQVIVEYGGILNVNNFTLEASIGGSGTPASSGQVSGEGELNVNGEEVYFQISFDPSGAISYGWYDFTVPFEVDVMNGVFDKDGNKLTYNVDYAVMEFSEEKRATNTGRPWVWFHRTMQPSKLYTITLDDEKNWNTFLFKKKKGSSVLGSNSFAASYSEVGATTDRGWNGIGNGTLHYCQLNNLPAQTKIQVEDHNNQCYIEKEASDYTYSVGKAFFVQVPSKQNVDLTAVSVERDFLAPARERRSTEEFRLALTAEDATYVADNLWVSASEEATGEYVIGHDLLKMGTPTEAKVAQMWTVSNNNRLCDIELPLANNVAYCDLNLFAPETKKYSLAVEKAPQDVVLYLTYNDRPIWNLTMSPYEFDLEQGTTEGYGLQLYVRQSPEVATGVDGVHDAEIGARKVLINDILYIITPEGKIYDAVGKGVNF